MHAVGQALCPHDLPQASRQFREGVISTPAVDDVEPYVVICPDSALLERGRQSRDLKTAGLVFCVVVAIASMSISPVLRTRALQLLWLFIVPGVQVVCVMCMRMHLTGLRGGPGRRNYREEE